MNIIILRTLLCILFGIALASGIEQNEPIESVDANFELTDAKTKKVDSLFEKVDSEFEIILRHIAHAKALLILYWQQREELNQNIPVDFKLKLIVRWMNCSQWEPYLHDIPSQNISIVDRKRLINLYDYDCVPDEFRNWCSDDPGRELSFTYVVEKRFGHSMKMEFVCDPNIEKYESGGSWSYGVALALMVIASIWAIRMYRRRTNPQNTEARVDPELCFPFKQDPNFLTVPLRVRPRTEDSGQKMMASRAGFELREKTRALSLVIGGTKPEDLRQKRPLQKIQVPKIFVYSPDD